MDELENCLIRLSIKELIEWCMDNNLLLRELNCSSCRYSMNFVSYNRNKDNFAWRCMNSLCTAYKNYVSLRKMSFFEEFKTPLLTILKIIIKYSTKTTRAAIINHFGNEKKLLVNKIIKKLVNEMPFPDFSLNKLGGPGKIVQIDETMLNFKCKSHRGRSAENKTDALCIVELEGNITRAFACVIPDKTSNTLVPIICLQVAANSIIWTDELRSYACLSSFHYVHQTVCHKYSFINGETGVNTQGVESFNNIIKCEIKKRKGVHTIDRTEFLVEMCWFFNNRDNIFLKLLELIKIH